MRPTVTEPNTGTACKTLRVQVPIYSYNPTTSLRLTNRMDTSSTVVRCVTGKDAEMPALCREQSDQFPALRHGFGHNRSIIRITPANKYATRKWRIYLLTKQNQG
jgi:hypothetical protein